MDIDVGEKEGRMIHRIKTVTYEVRSHRQKTILSKEGIVEGVFCVDEVGYNDVDRKILGRLIRHLNDVLKCMNKLEKKAEKEKACLPNKH